ncbi:MAG: hypothetical protein Q7T97_06300 [Burkholderiaceae bacterium]|nr:hypothetical protein [Burkholderiaceae bacterium]
MKDKWLLMLGGLVVVLVVFGLKVWHAQGICTDMSGRWFEGECYFDEKPTDVKLRR